MKHNKSNKWHAIWVTLLAVLTVGSVLAWTAGCRMNPETGEYVTDWSKVEIGSEEAVAFLHRQELIYAHDPDTSEMYAELAVQAELFHRGVVQMSKGEGMPSTFQETLTVLIGMVDMALLEVDPEDQSTVSGLSSLRGVLGLARML